MNASGWRATIAGLGAVASQARTSACRAGVPGSTRRRTGKAPTARGPRQDTRPSRARLYDAAAVSAQLSPKIDGVRALASLSVLTLHLSGVTGLLVGLPVGRYVARLEVGVAVFFVISGFLL